MKIFGNTILAALLLAVSPAALALAEPENGAARPGDQADLWAEHQAKIGSWRDQLWAKEMEYEGLVRGGGFNLPEARALLAEMLKLKEKIRGERLNFAKRARGLGDRFSHWGGPHWGGSRWDGSRWDGPRWGGPHCDVDTRRGDEARGRRDGWGRGNRYRGGCGGAWGYGG